MLSGLLTIVALGCGGSGPTQTPKTPPPSTTGSTVPSPTGAVTTTTLADHAEEEAAPLLAWAEGEPDEGKAPLTVQLKADTEGGKPPLKITWSFGDGSPDSNDANPKHTYDKPGKYRADLNVSDSAGDSDTDYVEIEVQ
jgi:PKD repeat protein